MRRGAMISAVVAVVAAGVFSSGCYYHRYWDAPYPPGPAIDVPPPPPLYEEVPAAWPDGLVWVTGYWHWAGGRYLWVRGRFVAPPAAGLYWYPGGYVRLRSGYAYVRGGWVGRGFRPYHRYVYGRPVWHRRYYAFPYHARPHAYGHGYGHGYGYGYGDRYRGRRYAPAPELRNGRRYAPAPELGGSPPYQQRRSRSAPAQGGAPRAVPPSAPVPSRRRAPPAP